MIYNFIPKSGTLVPVESEEEAFEIQEHCFNQSHYCWVVIFN